MWQQAMRFGLVGAFATLVHMAIGIILVHSGWQPLIANGVAFATAFLVSFVGHLGYSFADQDPDPAGALWRFGLVAVTGFFCNEALLALLIGTAHIPDTVSLCISTGAAAILTFTLARAWAFQSGRRDPEAEAPSRPDDAAPGQAAFRHDAIFRNRPR